MRACGGALRLELPEQAMYDTRLRIAHIFYSPIPTHYHRSKLYPVHFHVTSTLCSSSCVYTRSTLLFVDGHESNRNCKILDQASLACEDYVQGNEGTRHRVQHGPLRSIDGSCHIGGGGLILALVCHFLVDLRDDRLHFRLVLHLQLFLRCGGLGGWWSLPDAAIALAREPPSTSELLATAIPRLNDILVVVHRSIDVRDGYFVACLDIARRDEVHLRVAAVERRPGAGVAGVSDLQPCLDIITERREKRGGELT